MNLQFYEPGLDLEKALNILMLVGIGLVVIASLLFERNACALAAYIHDSGRLLSAKPDWSCRLLSFTY